MAEWISKRWSFWRAALTAALARENFSRELSPATFNDVTGGRLVFGNPELERAVLWHADARWELGYRKFNGRWVTEAEYYEAEGYVRWQDRWVTPEEFGEYREFALELGFSHCESGPLVRSSYHAHEQSESYKRQTSSS